MRNIIIGMIILLSSLYAVATNPTYENVSKIYVATFNRAPDRAGLDYWVNKSGLTLEQIAESFFDQPETQVLYPPGTSNRDFIKSVYQNLFNRDPDAGGWDYWEKGLDNHDYSRNIFIQTVINGAKDSDDGMDKTILNNKMLVALEYVNQLQDKTNITDTANPENEPAYFAAIKILSKIDGNTDTASEVISYIDTIAGDADPIGEILTNWNGGKLDGEVLMISSDGGSYKVDGLTVDIPADSIESEKALVVSKKTDENGFDSYTIQGLRNTFKKNIDLELPIPSGVDTSKLIVNYTIANGCYATSLDKMVDCSITLQGTVVDDKFKVTLPVNRPRQIERSISRDITDISAENTNKIYDKWIQNPDEQTVSLASSPAFDYESEHFLIHGPSMSYYDKVKDEIAPGLEYAYRILNNGLKLDLSKVPNPVNVYLVEPTIFNGLTNCIGMAISIPFMDSYIDINIDELDKEALTKKKLWAAVGHEFFHVVQRNYLSFSNTFLQEATSVWFENKVDMDGIWKDDSYSSDVALVNRNFLPYGLTSTYVGTKDTVFSVPHFTIDTEANLGYGASTFLDYITDCTSPQIIKTIFENVKVGQSNIDAIDNALRESDVSCYTTGNTLKDVWNAFVARDYMETNDVIKNDYLADYSLVVKIVSNTLDFEKKFMMGPFSAVGIRIDGRGKDSDSPDYTSVLVHFEGDNIVGEWNNLDGTTINTFPWQSGHTEILTVSKSGINSKEVVILSNPTKISSEVKLKMAVLTGDSCPNESPFGEEGSGTAYYKKSDNAYVACGYNHNVFRGECNFLNNKRDGIESAYDSYGRPVYIVSWKNGLQDGEDRRYKDGKLTECYIWSEGQYIKSCMPQN